MGKNLIIKGADFSENAVAHEAVEPTVFIQTAGYGPTGLTGYSDGDIYYRCSSAASALADNGLEGFFKKENGAASRMTDIGGQYAKLGNAYYQVTSTNVKAIIPYYGVKEVPFEFTIRKGYIYVDENTAPTEKTDSNAICSAIIPLTQGKHYQFYGNGSPSCNVLIVKKADGTYVAVTPNKGGARFLVDYTPSSAGEQAYFTFSIQSLTEYYWVGIVE